LPCAIDTLIWRSSVTIYSALNFFFGMAGSFPSYSLTAVGSKKPGQVIDIQSLRWIIFEILAGIESGP
jgi:hypothetical protein